MLVVLGLVMAAAVLNMARYASFLSEGVAGALYLLSGAVFPVHLLPLWVQPISLCLPPTYWLEGMRRAMLGPPEIPSPLGAWSHLGLAAGLASTTLVLTLVAYVFFSWSEHRAWRLGRYEETSGN
jgi:ABC-2 type transport system permease protein